MHIKQPFRIGIHNLPSNASIESPFAILNLFYNASILKTITEYTNKYAALYQPNPTEFPNHRPWKPITWKELRAYIAVYIWMGLHQELAVDEFWAEDKAGKPLYPEVSNYITRERWQQID